MKRTINYRFKRLLLGSLLALTLAGCWDRVEIDERGFVVGVAIDKAKTDRSKEVREAPDKPRGRHLYSVTYQFVVPSALGSSKGNQSGSSQASGFQNLTSQGDEMAQIKREISVRASRSPYFEHLKVVIVSEDVAKTEQSFADVLDFYIRDPEMRRETKVMIAKGEARSVLEVAPRTEKVNAMYIDSITNHQDENARMLPETKIGDIHEHLLREESYVVQRIVGKGNEVKLAGAAVMDGKTNTLVGFLGEEETEGLNYLTAKIKGGVVDFKLDGRLSSFENERTSRTIRADVSDPMRPKFHVRITAEGSLAETFATRDLTKLGTIEDIEGKIADEIVRLAQDTIRKVQKEFGKDVVGFGDKLRQDHYRVWKRIKADWEQGRRLFAASEITVEAKVKLRRYGTINKAKIIR